VSEFAKEKETRSYPLTGITPSRGYTYIFEEYPTENKNAERMGQSEQDTKTLNRANLKKLSKPELLEAKRSPHISYEFYCLVNAEIEGRNFKLPH
jgi:hypothetical protein